MPGSPGQGTTKVARFAAYDAERTAISLVRLGRRLGRDLVGLPDWGTMTAADFDAWTRRAWPNGCIRQRCRPDLIGPKSRSPSE
jgi:hypothetical protein